MRVWYILQKLSSLVVVLKIVYSTTRFFLLYFLAYFWFRKNLGSMPLVDTYRCLLAFLIPLAWALWVLLCAQVFFCCYIQIKSNQIKSNQIKSNQIKSKQRMDTKDEARSHHGGVSDRGRATKQGAGETHTQPIDLQFVFNRLIRHLSSLRWSIVATSFARAWTEKNIGHIVLTFTILTNYQGRTNDKIPCIDTEVAVAAAAA